jgi:hypothetical protein
MNFRMIWMGSDDDSKPSQPVPELAGPDQASGTLRYQERGTEIVRREEMSRGHVKFIPVANFKARIVRDLIVDDGDEQEREFTIEAEIGHCKLAFTVSAAHFVRMDWVLTQLGPQAIVYPGQHHHARAAIQSLSSHISQERIFTHLGWRKCGLDWLYLHAEGALGAAGAVAGTQVRLPGALQHFQLQTPQNSSQAANAIRASLRCLSVAPDRITIPLLASVYRAAFGRVDFSLFLTGTTGVFKTALTALCQQHLGANMDALRLPTNFASTANALEAIAFSAKDSLLTIDDFVPVGGSGDRALQGIAERLFRAAGNHQGRSRLSGERLASSGQPPRALLLASGEAVPAVASIRARLLIVEVAAGDVDLSTLSECQRAGHDGHLATSIGAFLCWIAGRFDELQSSLQTRALEIRQGGLGRSVHARLPGTLAQLQSAWEIFLEFAFEAGAIGKEEQQDLGKRNERALAQLAVLQAQYQEASDPTLRFVALLKEALASGHAHVADRRGKLPQEPAIWGWQRKRSGSGWSQQGIRIGWVIGSDLYLESAASYEVVQKIARVDRILVSEQTLRHRLRQRGMLASTDSGRQMVTVRRMLDGRSRQVLHLKVHDIVQNCESHP